MTGEFETVTVAIVFLSHGNRPRRTIHTLFWVHTIVGNAMICVFRQVAMTARTKRSNTVTIECLSIVPPYWSRSQVSIIGSVPKLINQRSLQVIFIRFGGDVPRFVKDENVCTIRKNNSFFYKIMTNKTHYWINDFHPKDRAKVMQRVVQNKSYKGRTKNAWISHILNHSTEFDRPTLSNYSVEELASIASTVSEIRIDNDTKMNGD
jgi:hypothetical protein